MRMSIIHNSELRTPNRLQPVPQYPHLPPPTFFTPLNLSRRLRFRLRFGQHGKGGQAPPSSAVPCISPLADRYAIGAALSMRFVETPVFTAALRRHLDDETYRVLQLALLLRPTEGPIIQDGAGLRKLRWAATGRGKRGGVRLIYYWEAASQTFYMHGGFKFQVQRVHTDDAAA